MTDRTITVCKKCGAPIEFLKSEKGKFIPVNDESYQVLVSDAGKTIRGRRSHFATCPYAETFRKKEGKTGGRR